jgi:L-asparaginase
MGSARVVRSGVGALVALACALPQGVSARQVPTPEDALPRVLVIATGGTIASRAGAPQIPGNELVEAVPELARHARITTEQFASVGSSAMTPDHWLRLARRVNEAFAADSGLAGIVVTHGTDSMEETGYFLHLTVRDERPVVVVGAMRSANAVSADGPANLLAAVRTAVSPEARGKGGLIVLNDRIYSARDVQKMDNNRVDAFRSEWGPLGVVDGDGVFFQRQIVTRHTVQAEFDLSLVEALPEVGIASDFAGHDGAGLHAWAGRTRGVVLETFGGGRTSPGGTRAAVEVAGGGVPVVLASRVAEGRVMTRSVSPVGGGGSVPMHEAGLVAARDLPAHKARVLLMLALTRTSDAAQIQRMFDVY